MCDDGIIYVVTNIYMGDNVMFYMIKVNGILLSNHLFYSYSDAIDACYEQKKLGYSVTTEIIRVDK